VSARPVLQDIFDFAHVKQEGPVGHQQRVESLGKEKPRNPLRAAGFEVPETFVLWWSMAAGSDSRL
jgi:hypothetical protein